MSISSGRRLGPYEILDRLGAGGMGEVYRARDTRLDRTVAIKVLAPDRVSDPRMRLRLEREARAVAALNHPHICHLNDIGHKDGVDFLVMEYLEGETLAMRLSRAAATSGALPIEEFLQYAIQIAEALSEAHRHGIVHRDLKPGNIILTKSGVKLLDFGLAKVQTGVGSAASGSTLAATRENPLTSEGSILGTWQYMAPEQLAGKEVDGRTDIFAFGGVVYEMATGHKAFEGDSHASLIAAILEHDPQPLSVRQPVAPAALERVVRKCLAKSPDARWQSARDLADALKWIAEERRSTSQVSGPAPAERSAPANRWPWILAIVAAIALGVAVASIVPRATSTPTISPVRRFVIQPPSEASVADAWFALSPDGRALVYEATDGRGLYLRSLDQLVARLIPGTERGWGPVFSPDAQWLAFFVGDTLKKVSLTSGASPVTLTDFRGLIDQSIAWLPDHGIVLGRFAAGLFRVPVEGGPPVRLTTPDTEHGEIDQHNPRWLPGGKAMLITRHRGSEAWDVAVLRLETGTIQVVIPDAFDARYLPTGHLVFARGETLLAVPFDVTRLEVSGPPVVMVDPILTVVDSGFARYAITDDGTLVYIPARSRAGRRLAWVGPNGVIDPLPLEPRAFTRPSLSPDGMRVAVQIDEGARRDIWVLDLATGTRNRVTFDGMSESPVWTRDGKRLTYSITKDGRREVYWQPADGSAAPERLVADTYSVWAGSWSPDSQRLMFTHQPPTDQNDIGIFDLGSRRTTMVLAGPQREQQPRFSPDGRWLAYSTSETGGAEVVVASLDGAVKRQISADGGTAPVWRPDGRVLYYRVSRSVFAVDVGGFPATIGKPTLVIEAAPFVSGFGGFGHPGYDVAADGRLLIAQADPEETTPIGFAVVLNWFTELKQRVPTR